MSNNKKRVRYFIRFPLMYPLGMILVIMKLFSVPPVAEWSWWLVTMPFWAMLAFTLVCYVFFVCMAFFVLICAALFRK